MFKRRQFLVATAVVSAGLLAGCVSQQKYNSLQQAYNQLQAAYQGDEVEIKQLQGELKVTIKDKILFPEGGYRLNAKAEQTLAKMVPTLGGFKDTKKLSCAAIPTMCRSARNFVVRVSRPTWIFPPGAPTTWSTFCSRRVESTLISAK